MQELGKIRHNEGNILRAVTLGGLDYARFECAVGVVKAKMKKDGCRLLEKLLFENSQKITNWFSVGWDVGEFY